MHRRTQGIQQRNCKPTVKVDNYSANPPFVGSSSFRSIAIAALALAGSLMRSPADKPEVTITIEGETRVIRSNGLPNHRPRPIPQRPQSERDRPAGPPSSA